MNLMELLEGPGIRRWYVARDDVRPEILAGPFPTRKRGAVEVFRIAKAAGDPHPRPRMESFEGYPGFYAYLTGAEVYYVGRAAAMHDQGEAWAEAINDYQRKA